MEGVRRQGGKKASAIRLLAYLSGIRFPSPILPCGAWHAARSRLKGKGDGRVLRCDLHEPVDLCSLRRVLVPCMLCTGLARSPRSLLLGLAGM